MVIAAFPAAKLGALLLKQISKPVANLVKHHAKNSPVFRKYVCLPPAQFYNWCELKSKMWLLNMGQPVNISVLNEAASIELGANLLGEAVIFIIAAGILLAEYNRGARKEAAKEEQKRAEMEALQNALKDLFMQTEEQAAHIRELTRRMGDLESRVVQKPWVPKKETPPPEPPREPPTFLPNYEPAEPDEDSNVEPSVEPLKTSDDIENAELLDNCKYKPLNDRPTNGLIFKGLSEIENDILYESKVSQRQPGLIMIALNQLYNDVYRIPLRF